MGISYWVKCDKCGERYRAFRVETPFTHILHCKRCGIERTISFDELGEIHVAYLKGRRRPYSLVTEEHDKLLTENYCGAPLRLRSYNSQVEKLVGKCKCGGVFRLDTLPRCPRCNSGEYSILPE